MDIKSSQRQVRELATALYAEKRDYLLTIARRNALNDADADEALQEAFASFIRAFDPDGGAPPLAWLTLTLKRQCWRQRRAAHLDRQLGQEGRERGRRAGLLPRGAALSRNSTPSSESPSATTAVVACAD